MKTILILFLALNLYANVKQNMFNLYQNQKYEDACGIGFNNFYANKDDEEFVLLYSFACLNSDYIDRLAVPITMLKLSTESRSNAAYFSTILMQKKLLYHALIDDYDLSMFKFPTTQYVLSKVFDLYSKLGKHETRAFYLFEDPDDKKITYKVYIIKNQDLSKLIIEEFYDTISLKRHIYW
jgi:hypothetical protein